jgi:limonene-1,2-epoxide hydrolase
MMDTGQTAEEQANVAVALAFCQSWNDPALCVSMVNADASLKLFVSKPPVIGPAAMEAEMRKAMADITIDVDVHRVFVQGPVLVVVRTDVMHFPDGRERVVKVIGYFLFKNSKIQEWFDIIESEFTREKTA